MKRIIVMTVHIDLNVCNSSPPLPDGCSASSLSSRRKQDKLSPPSKLLYIMSNSMKSLFGQLESHGLIQFPLNCLGPLQ